MKLTVFFKRTFRYFKIDDRHKFENLPWDIFGEIMPIVRTLVAIFLFELLWGGMMCE